MKVLIFTTVFPNADQPVHGLFVAERIRHAAQFADVRVIAPVGWLRPKTASAGVGLPGAARLSVEHPRWIYVPGALKSLDGGFLFLCGLRAALRLRKRFDFDLIDAHFGYPDGVAAILLGAWFHRPVTITLRGSELVMAQYRLRRAILGWALRRAARVIAVSPELADLARNLGTAEQAIRIIGNGIDLERFRPMDRRAVRRDLGIPESATLLVSVGHLAQVKGFERVIRALPGLVADHPGIKFVIVGGPAAASGTYPQFLSSEIARLGLSNRVTITGAVTPERVAQWLNAADLFVLGSTREGSPNALREAMACGCPAVASDVGDAGHIVNGSSGLLVENVDDHGAWHGVLSAALRRPWDRAAIRIEAERHSWHDVAWRVKTEWESCAKTVGDGVRARASAR